MVLSTHKSHNQYDQYKYNLKMSHYSANSERDEEYLDALLEEFDLLHLQEHDEEAQEQVELLLHNGCPRDGNDDAMREDLTDLVTVCVDGSRTHVFEDSLGYDFTNERVYVMISDPGRVVGWRGAIFRRALKQVRSAYFGRFVFHMLDHKLISDFVHHHGKHTDGRAIAISFCMQDDGQVDSETIWLQLATISKPERKRPEEVDNLLRSGGSTPVVRVLTSLNLICDKHRDYRLQHAEEDLVPGRSSADYLVEECMLMANHAVSVFTEREGIPVWHRVTDKRGHIHYTVNSGYHGKMGLHGVSDITSPCRRVVGLISLANIRAYTMRNDYPFSKKDLKKLTNDVEKKSKAIHQAQKRYQARNQHRRGSERSSRRRESNARRDSTCSQSSTSSRRRSFATPFRSERSRRTRDSDNWSTVTRNSRKR